MQNLNATRPTIDSIEFFKTSFWGEKIPEKKIQKIISKKEAGRDE